MGSFFSPFSENHFVLFKEYLLCTHEIEAIEYEYAVSGNVLIYGSWKYFFCFFNCNLIFF